MTRAALLATLLAAAPAAAQDLGAQFEAALAAFVLPTAQDLSVGGLLEEEAVEALLPSLEGDWTHGLLLFQGRGAFDAATLADSCARLPLTLVRIAPRSFELRRVAGGEGAPRTLAIRHDFLQGNAFDRSVGEAEAMAFLGLDAMPDPAAGMLRFEAMRGEVAMFHPSPDVLVFVDPGAPPEILLRCP